METSAFEARSAPLPYPTFWRRAGNELMSQVIVLKFWTFPSSVQYTSTAYTSRCPTNTTVHRGPSVAFTRGQPAGSRLMERLVA
jgi:hypothetical protein